MSDFDRVLADSLKAIRDDHVRQIEAEVPAARRQIADRLRGRRFRFVAGGTALAAAAVAAFVFVSTTVPKIDEATPIKPAGEPVVVRRIDVPGVAEMEAGLGSMWVAHHEGVLAIDPATGEIGRKSPVSAADGMAFDSEAMFAIDIGDRSISRIPFGSDESAISTSMEGTPTLIAASEEAVWVAAATGPEGHSQITAYTPHLERPGGTAAALEGRVVADMLHADGSLWMSASKAAPSEGFEVHRFTGGESQLWELSTVEGSPADITVGEGAAWILRHRTEVGGNTITRIGLDADVNERAVSFDDTIEAIAVGEGYLWVTTAPTGMDMPDDVRASLHRIDPVTLEPVGEPLDVAGPGSKLAVGYGSVWVGDPNNKQIVQIDPFGESSPSPELSTSPGPSETQGPEPSDEQGKCRTFLPFLSPDGAYRLGLGSGGQEGVPLAQQNPRALVHYSEEPGRFIDVIAGETVSSPVDEEDIEVLGAMGTLHRIEDGYAVTFAMGGCEFQLLAYGSDPAAVRDFVSTLVLRGDAEASSDAFALWPESKPEDAYESCAYLSIQYRNSARGTATAFAVEELRWTDAVPVAGDLSVQGGFTSVQLERESEPSAKVDVLVRQVAPSCWSVASVSTPVPRGEPTSLSVNKRGEKLIVGFSLAARGLEEFAAAIRMPIENGDLAMSADEFRAQNERIEVVRGSQDEAPGGFLVLIEDVNGRVIGAIGMALPSGDFVAG